jgi:hypothetical protein
LKSVQQEYPDIHIPFSVQLLANMHKAITKHVVPATHLVIGSNVWSAMVVDPAVQKMFEPVAKHEDLLKGFLGTIIGLDIVTDAFNHPEDRFVDKDFCSVASVRDGTMIRSVSLLVS